MSSSALFVTFLTASITATTITCNGVMQCSSQRLNCSSDEECHIHCSNYKSCEQAILQCPITHTCYIYCTDHLSCYNADIYCPNDDHNDTNTLCHIIGADAYCSLCDIDVYAINGFDDLNITCASSACISNANIHCNPEYNAQCSIDSTLNKCNLTDPNQYCTDIYNPTSYPALKPTQIPSISYKSSFICDAINKCTNTILNCPQDLECFVECTATSACINTTIQCTDKQQCHLLCLESQSCINTTIYAISSTHLFVSFNGHHALSSSNVYCPDNGPYSDNPQSNCHFIVNNQSPVSNINIYAIEGFNDVAVGCPFDMCGFTGTMHCTRDYSVSCRIDDVSGGECASSAEICNNYMLSAFELTIIADTNKIPSINPTPSPTETDDVIWTILLKWKHVVYVLLVILIVLLLTGVCCLFLLLKKRSLNKHERTETKGNRSSSVIKISNKTTHVAMVPSSSAMMDDLNRKHKVSFLGSELRSNLSSNVSRSSHVPTHSQDSSHHSTESSHVLTQNALLDCMEPMIAFITDESDDATPMPHDANTLPPSEEDSARLKIQKTTFDDTIVHQMMIVDT